MRQGKAGGSSFVYNQSLREDGETQRQKEQGSPQDGVMGLRGRSCWFPELLLPEFLLFAPSAMRESRTSE